MAAANKKLLTFVTGNAKKLEEVKAIMGSICQVKLCICFLKPFY